MYSQLQTTEYICLDQGLCLCVCLLSSAEVLCPPGGGSSLAGEPGGYNSSGNIGMGGEGFGINEFEEETKGEISRQR